MSKRLIVVLALALVAGLTIAAYAEVQNVKVSGDLLIQGVSRKNIQLRGNDQNHIRTLQNVEYGPSISGLLSAVRVRIDADLTDNVATTVRLLNERVWDAETNTSTDIDLDLAFVALKEFLYSPLSLTLGRQELAYGNQLIIGDVDTNGIAAGHGLAAGTAGTILPKSLDDLSVRKAFDALKATLNYDPLVIDLVYSKVDENLIDNNDDVNLYGGNATYALNKDTTVEGYYWEKMRKKAQSSGQGVATNSHNDVVRTVGSRVQYSGIKNMLLSVEGAYQFGEKINNTSIYPDDRISDGGWRKRQAYAAQLVSLYNLTDLVAAFDRVKKLEPSLKVTYTLLSGEAYKNDKKKWHGWDAMYENQAGGTLFNKIMGYSNSQLINAGLSLKPMEDVKLALEYYHIRLIKALGLGSNGDDPNGGAGVNLTGVLGDPTYKMIKGEKELGNEIDATLTYDYTEDVQLGLSAGAFIPGDAFSGANDKTATQVIGSMKVTF